MVVQLADGKARHTHIGHDRQPSFHLVNGSDTAVGTPSWCRWLFSTSRGGALCRSLEGGCDR